MAKGAAAKPRPFSQVNLVKPQFRRFSASVDESARTCFINRRPGRGAIPSGAKARRLCGSQWHGWKPCPSQKPLRTIYETRSRKHSSTGMGSHEPSRKIGAPQVLGSDGKGERKFVWWTF